MNGGLKNRIGQFAPTRQKPNYPGVLGWGFDTHGYRIVMYGPPEWDTAQTRTAIKEIKKSAHVHAKNDDFEGRKKSIKRRAEKITKSISEDNRHDHPPAHIHVIHLATGRESKFELIEHYDTNKSSVRYLRNGHGGLSGPQINEADTLLAPYIEEFIKLWRELYQEYGTSRYVARVSNVGSESDPVDIEHIPYKVRNDSGHKEYWLEIREKDGNITRVPPPLDDKKLPKRHSDSIAKGRRKSPEIWDLL